MAGVSGVERDVIFLEKLDQTKLLPSENKTKKVGTEIHKMIEQVLDQENSVHIALFLYRHRSFPLFDFQQNDYPIDTVHEEFVDKLV